ncbi:hypothetical protein ABIC22_004440 [Paenibacillus sp. PvP094]|uniref:DUF3888 domain-containing protein n=1 Tax=Paenibacillus TaxID=44249 RepID=UPI000FDB3301|nr:DUF3888 domain-containing protein [Paenibacillus illinoisensis]
MFGRVIRRLLVLLLCLTLILEPTKTYAESDTNCKDQRLILTLLSPKIEEQLTLFYKDRLIEKPMFAPFLGGNDLKLDYHDSHIIAHVTVEPYVGPHLSVGQDLITFHINNSGEVKVIAYHHIKNYELPPHWRKVVIPTATFRQM